MYSRFMPPARTIHKIYMRYEPTFGLHLQSVFLHKEVGQSNYGSGRSSFLPSRYPN